MEMHRRAGGDPSFRTSKAHCPKRHSASSPLAPRSRGHLTSRPRRFRVSTLKFVRRSDTAPCGSYLVGGILIVSANRGFSANIKYLVTLTFYMPHTKYIRKPMIDADFHPQPAEDASRGREGMQHRDRLSRGMAGAVSHVVERLSATTRNPRPTCPSPGFTNSLLRLEASQGRFERGVITLSIALSPLATIANVQPWWPESIEMKTDTPRNSRS